MRVSKWGNSLTIQLPAAVLEALELKEGDDIQVEVVDSRVFRLRKTPDALAFLARIRQFRGKLPKDFHFDRDAADDRDLRLLRHHFVALLTLQQRYQSAQSRACSCNWLHYHCVSIK